MDSSAPNDTTKHGKTPGYSVDTKWCVLCTEYVEYGHCCDPANPDNYDTEEHDGNE